MSSVVGKNVLFASPVFAVPLAQLFNQSVVEGAVPSQWRTAVITPIPKVPKPTQAADYRPISITPVLSRSLEKYSTSCERSSTQRYNCYIQSSALTTSSPSGRPVQQLPRS